METVQSSSSAELLRAQTHFSTQLFSFQNYASLKCALHLGIPDAIKQHGKPMNLSELTSALPIKPSKAPYIHRLMRMLVKAGYFAQENECFDLTPIGLLLLKDDPINIRALVLLELHPALLLPWIALSEWFQNDDATPFVTAHGKSFWDYTSRDPEFRKLFDEAMAGDSELISKVLVTEFKYVFEGLKSLVDVGGGNGTLARSIAKAFPNLKCTVFDLPEAVANEQGDGNLDFVAGDMFDRVPSADAILLKIVLHDWSDENCVKILKNCRKSIPVKDKGGKVIIIEGVVELEKNAGNEYAGLENLDMEMLVLYNSKERTKKEWAKLFSDAGFSDYKFIPALDSWCIIELTP
uniref:Cephaeline 6'-O-methyltransferase CiOMT n=1 Tax=Carapichea ipecacuanha TaxID=77880 RepID=CIOMT_CARIP|nr:7'-O-demethylcephaeline/cephaeline O-methyltransferase [Carapichea ipecacuanha]